MLTELEATTIGNAILSAVQNLAIPNIHQAAAAAGMDASQLPPEPDRMKLMPKVYALFASLSYEHKLKAIPILAERVFEKQHHHDALVKLLEQHGFQYSDGTLLQIGFFDEREAKHLPQSAAAEISSAMDRLEKGDLSGAITNACGAVDSATSQLIQKHGLGTATAFAAKVNTVLNALKIFDGLRDEIAALGVPEPDATGIAHDLHEATKKATDALGAMRRTMGDVHGQKKANVQMVYSSVKLASAICGFLEK